MLIMTAALLLSASAEAATTAGAQPAASPPAKEQKICKVRRRTNSRFTQWTCQTKSEYDTQTEETQRNAQEQLNRPSSNPVSSG